jgi:uncharacterized membrane protein YhaH (DUF805 family)
MILSSDLPTGGRIERMEYLWACVLVVVLLVGWGLNLLTLPGNWLMVAAVAGYAWWGALSWWSVAVLALLATIGEVLEALAGAE